jgi:hypothetical protein
MKKAVLRKLSLMNAAAAVAAKEREGSYPKKVVDASTNVDPVCKGGAEGAGSDQLVRPFRPVRPVSDTSETSDQSVIPARRATSQ